MDEEFSSYEKRTFISKLNPESPPFQPASYYQHIQEIPQSKVSSEDNKNHLHFQPIVNGHDDNRDYNSTAIHSIEPSEYISSPTHYIQEMIPNYEQYSTTSSHIQPVNISDNDIFAQSLIQTKQDGDKKEENTEQISFEQSATSNNEDQSELFLVDDQTLNTKPDLDIQQNLEEKPDELKAQRELDEDEIPPADLPVDQSSTHIETNNSSNEFEANIIDSCPLTQLESPYEHHETNESSSTLPDIIAETLEENSSEFIPQTQSLPSELDDILGNKSLLKQTIKSGISDTRPARNSIATVSYTLFLIDNSTSNSRLIETISNESFCVAECDILPAIDISVQLMDRGEHALIDADIRHCYGQIGCQEKQIPPPSSTDAYRMKIDIELHDWKLPQEIQTLTIDERLHWSNKKQQMGNFSYNRKEYSTALQCYRNALKFLDTDENPLLNEDNQNSILIDRFIQVQNNLAQVYLLSNQYDQCLDAVNKVFKYDSKNLKALFRQAKALIELGNYDQALQPLKFLLKCQNTDVDKPKVNEMLNICETKLAKYHKNEKEICQRMFKSPPPSPPTTTTRINEIPQTKVENKNSVWWPYVAMGSAAIAAIGLAAIIKYR